MSFAFHTILLILYVITGYLRSHFATDQGYAIVVTHSHAIIWPYETVSSSPPPADVFTVTIPEFCKDASDLTPFGFIVSNSTSGTPGLLILSPSTGRMVYWETLSDASVLGLVRQKHIGIQGTISGLLSGEHVTDITNTEPSGVIVTFSSGRIAHITLRDPQGKPSVSVSFLRNAARITSGGLFNGIKSVLGGTSWRKEVAAVKAGDTFQRGQRDVIVVTSEGRLQIWDTHWNNGNILRGEVDIRPNVCEALSENQLDPTLEHDVKVLDLVCVVEEHKGSADPGQTGCQSTKLFCLVSSSPRSGPTTVAVLELRLTGSEICVISTFPVEVQNLKLNLDGTKPKLHIPRPRSTAFIIWGQNVIILSLAKSKDSPSAELSMASKLASLPFQDRLCFRAQEQCEVLGTEAEDQNSEHKHPACIVMTRGFGVVRVAALPRKCLSNGLEGTHVTAKHKLEQIVFYGMMSGNPLDFDDADALAFLPEELEDAALGICREVLQSRSKYIANSTSSIEKHLRFRAKVLDDLAYLLTRHKTPLSKQTRWELLWGAEKLASQKAMWKVEESFRQKNHGAPTFLSLVIESMSENFKTRFRPAKGVENDPVRHWFVNDTYRMEHILPWIVKTIREQKVGLLRNGPHSLQKLFEAGDFSLSVLETAFQFREDHAYSYGLGEETFEGGVLLGGYDELPEFWTSQGISYQEMEQLLDLQLESCRAWMQSPTSRNESTYSIIVKVARNCFRQLIVLGKMNRERVCWLSAQADPKSLAESVAITESHVKQRKWQILKLAGIGQLEEAFSVAEEFRDMGALVELIVELRDQIDERQLQQNPFQQRSRLVDEGLPSFERRVASYFERFGELWANAFFLRHVADQPGLLLTLREYQPFVTRFLRKVPSYSRLGWINDILGENEYDIASQNLENLALHHECNLWSKRVELSLAKLTELAALENATDAQQSNAQDRIRRLENSAEISTIQDMVYDHILPVLHGAIDQKAALELAVEHFAKRTDEQFPALHEVLEDALSKLVAGEVLEVDQLVDLLTLMDPVQFLESEENDLVGREFYLSLRVLHLSCYAHSEPVYYEMLQRLVWRRCMVRDNWETLGETAPTLDDETKSRFHNTALFRTLTECMVEGIDLHGVVYSMLTILQNYTKTEIVRPYTGGILHRRLQNALSTITTLQVVSERNSGLMS